MLDSCVMSSGVTEQGYQLKSKRAAVCRYSDVPVMDGETVGSLLTLLELSRPAENTQIPEFLYVIVTQTPRLVGASAMLTL